MVKVYSEEVVKPNGRRAYHVLCTHSISGEAFDGLLRFVTIHKNEVEGLKKQVAEQFERRGFDVEIL